MIKDYANKTNINVKGNEFSREFSMDEDEYNNIAERAENGEFIDFQIPKNAPIGKRYSEVIEKKPVDDYEPVDLAQEFGGGING